MLKTSVNDIANKILNLLKDHRRELIDTTSANENYTSVHLIKLITAIETAKPIQFILPAFPAKSPNREKTNSALPDLGERLSLTFLNTLAEKINQIYTHGVNIIICSDGRVFNDLVQVSDADVDAYADGINKIIADDNLSHLQMLNLENYYQYNSYYKMRQQLESDYALSIDKIKENVKDDAHYQQLFNGMHRFIFEDQLQLSTHYSRNKVRELSKQMTYQVISRSQAWSKLLETAYPEAIRLSIHPQSKQSPKLGIMLLKSKTFGQRLGIAL